MTGLVVDGYVVGELLGFGATGEVWSAREEATGDLVALKRLRPDRAGSQDEQQRLRREAAVLAGAAHPHVVRLRAVVGSGADQVLVLDHAGGGSLAGLMASRGRLTPGEVVTVATPLAQALAAVHARGVVHGDVTPGNVLFAADGRPLLSDLGVARLVGVAGESAGTRDYVDPAVLGGAEPTGASDVYGLAAVCHAALLGHPPALWLTGASSVPGPASTRAELGLVAPAALADAVSAALDLDPAGRPSAAELARAVFDACPAEPVELAPRRAGSALAVEGSVSGQALTYRAAARGAGPPATPPVAPGGASGRRRGRRRRALLPTGRRAGSPGRRSVPRPGAGRWRAVAGASVVLAGLVVAAVVGTSWARETRTDRAGGVAAPDSAGPHAHLSAGRSAQTGPRDWAAVLGRLDERRARAYAAGRPSVLAAVYLRGSPAGARDRAAVAALASRGLRAPGLRLRAVEVRVARATGDRVVLRVVDRLRPYLVVDTDGRVVARRAGRGEVTWRVTLRRDGGGWRYYEVTRAA